MGYIDLIHFFLFKNQLILAVKATETISTPQN
jgi:hypothetical protein